MVPACRAAPHSAGPQGAALYLQLSKLGFVASVPTQKPAPGLEMRFSSHDVCTVAFLKSGSLDVKTTDHVAVRSTKDLQLS
jgi:hypothetical protein